jgi:hypothetical protein
MGLYGLPFYFIARIATVAYSATVSMLAGTFQVVKPSRTLTFFMLILTTFP